MTACEDMTEHTSAYILLNRISIARIALDKLEASVLANKLSAEECDGCAEELDSLHAVGAAR